jgi:hypothetical protein
MSLFTMSQLKSMFQKWFVKKRNFWNKQITNIKIVSFFTDNLIKSK